MLQHNLILFFHKQSFSNYHRLWKSNRTYNLSHSHNSFLKQIIRLTSLNPIFRCTDRLSSFSNSQSLANSRQPLFFAHLSQVSTNCLANPCLRKTSFTKIPSKYPTGLELVPST